MFYLTIQWLTENLCLVIVKVPYCTLNRVNIGAFIVMGLLIALKNVIDKKLKEHQPQVATEPSVTRARITKVS